MKPFLLVVGPVANSGGDFVVDDPGYGFVVGVFEPKWACAVGGTVDTVDGVVVGGALGQKNAKVGVEGVGREGATHHCILGSLECAVSHWASVMPAPVSDPIFARGAVFRPFEELGVVLFTWRVNVGKVDRNGVFGSEFSGKCGVYWFEFEGIAPVGDDCVFFGVGVVGDGAVGFDNTDIYRFSVEG